MEQLLDLLACQLATTGQLTEHALAVGARLVDHLATLLLGHRQLCLGVGTGVGSAARRFDLGFFAHARGLVGRLGEHLGGRLLRLLADLDGTLAGGGQHPRRLFTEHAGEGLVVELDRCEIGVRLSRAQLALQEAFALLQPAELGGDHAHEVAHLTLIEPAACGAEAGVGDCRRRGRVRTREGHGHDPTLRIPAREMVAIGPIGRRSVHGAPARSSDLHERVAPEPLEDGECFIERGDRDDLHLAASGVMEALQCFG